MYIYTHTLYYVYIYIYTHIHTCIHIIMCTAVSAPSLVWGGVSALGRGRGKGWEDDPNLPFGWPRAFYSGKRRWNHGKTMVKPWFKHVLYHILLPTPQDVLTWNKLKHSDVRWRSRISWRKRARLPRFRQEIRILLEVLGFIQLHMWIQDSFTILNHLFQG